MSTEAVVCKCNGTGRLTYHHKHEPIQADGYRIEGSTSGSHLCPCRQVLEPRAGEAAWWTLETVHHEFWQGGLCSAEFTVQAEVPVSKDNYKVHRRGNRYWPTSVDVDHEPLRFIDGDEAQQFAAALKRAADKAAEIDAADADVCGHWAPCDCNASGSKRRYEKDA